MNRTSRQPPDLSVSIVLHHSELERLAACLTSLQQSAATAIEGGSLGEVRVSLVDNSCSERYRGEVEALLTALETAPGFSSELLVLPSNLGFGHGHNRILKAVDSQFHLVLNPDTELEPDTLAQGLAVLAGDEAAVLVSPRVTGPDGAQEFLCKRYPSVLTLFLRGFAPRFVRSLFSGRLGRYEMRDLCTGAQPVDVPIASGCFMLVRVDALQSIGGFDDDFFLYFEDFDLSMRLAQYGRLVYVPAMQIRHFGGYAARKGLRHVRYFVASAARFFHRHGWQWL